jgi:DNA-binding NtrC family response regulator
MDKSESANSYDVLLVAPDPSDRAAISRVLKARLGARVSEHGSARSALVSYSSARFDALLCDSNLTNPDCWCFLRMVRSGRFGYAETPAFVLASPQEQPALSGLADEFTRVFDSSSPDDAIDQIDRHRSIHHRPTILIVEDEANAAAAAQRALGKYFEVEVCRDAESALTAWRARRHEMILLDLMLPGMSGADLLPLILKDQPSQPVIILTAYDALERHQELMLSGASEFLAKPNNMRDLPGLCSRILRDHALLQSAQRARSAAEQLVQLSDRLQAANYTLVRGRTGEATMHLQRAMDVFRVSDTFRRNSPGDDQWTALVQEFQQPHAKTTS